MQLQLPPVWRDAEIFEIAGQSLPWHITDVALDTFWGKTRGGEGIRLGIVDTGIDPDHPLIMGKIRETANFSRNRRGLRHKDAFDGNGHGTHVATTIAQMAPQAEFVIAKGLSDSGVGYSEDIADAIDYCVDEGCHIVNLSLGGSYDDPSTRSAIERGKRRDRIFFAATGNEAASAVGYPARHCVGVGAVARDRQLAWFSNRGKHVDLVGYGVDILAGVPGGRYQKMSGTSMATPWVAAIAANRLSAEVAHRGEIYTNSDERLRELETFVTDLGPTGKDTSYGRGMPNLERLFSERLEPATDPDEPTDIDPGEAILLVGHGEHSGQPWKGELRVVRDG